MKTYPHIRRAIAGKLWYVHEQKMNEMLAFLEIKLAGGSSTGEVVESIRAANQLAAARSQAASGSGGAVQVIPVYGMIMHRQMQDISGGSSGTSTNALSVALQQALSDPNVSAIVLDIDSPGGDVDGVDELAAEIYQARKQKKITAVSNCLCASAAYYLAAQASEIVVSPSSLTGSIGVYTMHEDDSAMLESAGIKLELIKFGENKAEGNSLGPLTDSARTHLQEMVDTYGVAFEKAVARGRGIKQDDVHKKFGQGRVFDAKQAVRIGMADRVGTLADVLGAYGASNGSKARSTASNAAGGVSSATFDVPASDASLTQGVKADDGCTCECVPCDGGDCADCDHADCDCAGCTCEMATAKAKAAVDAKAAAEAEQLAIARAATFARMGHQLAISQRW